MKFNVTVEDKNGHKLDEKELREKVIDNDQFYLNMDIIMKRINEFRQGTNV